MVASVVLILLFILHHVSCVPSLHIRILRAIFSFLDMSFTLKVTHHIKTPIPVYCKLI